MTYRLQTLTLAMLIARLAVLGLGAFALPAARFMGTDELRGVFQISPGKVVKPTGSDTSGSASPAATPSSRPYPTSRRTTDPFFCSIQA